MSQAASSGRQTASAGRCARSRALVAASALILMWGAGWGAAAQVPEDPSTGADAATGFRSLVAHGRPYRADDMLAAESFGNATIDPTGRWAVFEQRAPYDQATSFEFGLRNPWTVSRLRAVNLALGRPAEALLRPEEGEGHVLGPWSPSGRRLLIFRLRDHRWQAGVMEMADRTVRWFPLSPELSVFGEAAQWRSDDELVLLARPDGSLPQWLASGGRGRRALEARWRATDLGGPAQRTTLGSGAFADDMPMPPQNQAVRLDVRSGIVTPLAAGWFYDLELSPDGERLALVETAAAAAFDPASAFEPQAIDRERRLRLADLTTGALTSPLGEADVAPSLLSWSPASDRLLVWTRAAEGWEVGDLVGVDPDGGSALRYDLGGLRPYTGGGVAAFNSVYADWLGDRPVIFAHAPTSERNDWHRLAREGAVNLTAALGPPSAEIGALDGERLLLVAGGRPWAVTVAGDAAPMSAPPGVVTGFDGVGYLESQRRQRNSPPRRGWMAIRTSGGAIIRPDLDPDVTTKGDAFVSGVYAGGDGVIVRAVDNGVQTLRLQQPGRPDRTLSTINPWMADIDFPEPERVRHRGTDGVERISWLYRPRHWRGEKTPLVVLSYPGGPAAAPSEPAALNAWANPQLVVSRGYAVLIPILPLDREKEPAEGYAEEVLAVVDAALAQYPDLDPDRVAHWGHSFGGYVGLVAATQTDRFKAVISVAGLSDLATAWGEFSPANRDNPEFGISLRQRIGWAEESQGRMRAPPWAAADLYVRNSPLFAADRISAPVLLVHGDRDLLPSTQSEIMFSALWRQNKDARLLTYWGEGHHLWSPDNIRDLYAEIVAFLDRTLDAGEASPLLTPRPRSPPSAGPSSPLPPPS
mgnify:FL=1